MEQDASKERPDGIGLLAGLFWVLAILAIIGGLFMIGAKEPIIDVIEEEGETSQSVIDLVESLLLGIGTILIIIGIIDIIIGWGLWTLQPWARIAGIILAILSLLNFPIGTIFGIIILWYLFKPEIKEAFQT
jgi:hypothetical protein